MGSAASRHLIYSETRDVNAANDANDVHTGAVVEDAATAQEIVVSIIESTATMDVDQDLLLTESCVSNTDNRREDGPFVTRGKDRAPQVATGSRRSDDAEARNALIEFEPEHPLAVFDILREVYHHNFSIDSPNSYVHSLEEFFPVSEYCKLVEIGWLHERDFDWPDAKDALARGRANLSCPNRPAYTLPKAKTSPRPTEGERVMLQTRYCKDICLIAARERARVRARALGQTVASAVPTKRDYGKEWKIVFDSVVRNMRTLEKRYMIAEEVEEMIVRVRASAASGRRKERKRRREDNLESHETLREDGGANANAECGHPAKLRKLSDGAYDRCAGARELGKERAYPNKPPFPQQPLKPSLKSGTVVEKRNGLGKARTLKVRFAEPAVLYDASVAMESLSQAGCSSKRKVTEEPYGEASTKRRKLRQPSLGPMMRNESVIIDVDEPVDDQASLSVATAVSTDEARVIRPLPRRHRVGDGSRADNTLLRTTSHDNVEHLPLQGQSRVQRHQPKASFAPSMSDEPAITNPHRSRAQQSFPTCDFTFRMSLDG